MADTHRTHIATPVGWCEEFQVKSKGTRGKMIKARRMELDWADTSEFLKGWKTPEDDTHSVHWHGGNRATMEALLKDGSRKGLDDAEKLLREIDTNLDVYGLGSTWSSDVVGGSPRVGAYLSGAPNCMNRYRILDSPRGVVRVYVNTALSASVTAEQQYKRGVACVALANALAKFRPVELWAYDNSHIHGDASMDVAMLVKLSTAPLDLSATCAALCTLSFSRGYMHNAANKAAGASNAKRHFGYATIAWSEASAAALLEMEPQDVLTPPGFSGSSEMVTDPVKWVQEELRKALKGSGVSHDDLYTDSGEAAMFADS